MQFKWLIAPAILGLAIGCQSGAKPKTAKQQATERWNEARSGVQASLAKQQFDAGDFVKCRQTLDEALKLTPDRADLHILSGKLSIEQGQLELAEKSLARARELSPNAAEAYYLAGVICQRWQKPQKAYEFYSAAVERAPAELSYLMAQAETLVAMDREDQALPLLQQKVIYFEHSAAIRDAVGQLLWQKGQYHEAVDMFRQATVLASEDQHFRTHLGLSLYYDRQYAAAAEVINRLVVQEQFADRVDLLTALGECQLQTGKARDARTNFETAARLNPSLARIWSGLGRAALESGDARRAELALQKALALEPQAPETQLLLGYVRLRQGRLDDALGAFNKAASLAPNDTVAICMIGYVMEKQGRGDAALRYYSKALKIDPTDGMAQQLLAGVETN